MRPKAPPRSTRRKNGGDDRDGCSERLGARYDDGAVIVVAPYMADNSGDVLRWVVQIDGIDVPEIEVRIDPQSERPDLMVMRLV